MYLSATDAALLPAFLPAAPVCTRATKRRRLWPLLGPAFVASVPYVDPGNFATNFSGGASFGYTQLWVIVAAKLMAMFIQSFTAKLGLATGRDLATLCRERLPRPLTWALWLQAEAVAMAQQWLAAIEELKSDGLENIPVPEAFPLEEEVADLGYVFIDASDGPDAASGRWASGPSIDGRAQFSARPIEATADAPILPPGDPRLSPTPQMERQSMLQKAKDMLTPPSRSRSPPHPVGTPSRASSSSPV